jgi:hypothetical protein
MAASLDPEHTSAKHQALDRFVRKPKGREELLRCGGAGGATHRIAAQALPTGNFQNISCREGSNDTLSGRFAPHLPFTGHAPLARPVRYGIRIAALPARMASCHHAYPVFSLPDGIPVAPSTYGMRDVS